MKKEVQKVTNGDDKILTTNIVDETGRIREKEKEEWAPMMDDINATSKRKIQGRSLPTLGFVCLAHPVGTYSI